MLRISTITAICSVNADINIFEMFNLIEAPYTYETFTLNTCILEHNVKGNFIEKRKINQKLFGNQMTLMINGNDRSNVNIKIFKNGKIQITGLKSETEGIRIVKEISNRYNLIFDENSFKICLINSDFGFKMLIKRDQLYNFLYDKIQCSYEPCIYPGVKIKYMWHRRNSSNNGQCTCDQTCIGNGTGELGQPCRKVTIVLFQSGKVIITGGQSMTQIDAAYQYICSIVDKHKHIFTMV